jgi:hypothetical protein
MIQWHWIAYAMRLQGKADRLGIIENEKGKKNLLMVMEPQSSEIGVVNNVVM